MTKSQQSSLKSLGLTKSATKSKVRNTQLRNEGNNSIQQRGSTQTAAHYSTNPYFRNDFYSRWQELVRWYYTSWEVKKVIDIPIDDAFREGFEIEGLEPDELDALMSAWKRFNIDDAFRRLCTQERLLGGSIAIIGLKSDSDDTESPLDIHQVNAGDFSFLNVVSVDKISNVEYNNDPFSPNFNSPEFYFINGHKVHISRLIVFDGRPLFDRNSMNILQNFRYNPAGFGESVLTNLYDTLVHVTGTQQGAFHLINMASVLLVSANNVRMLKASNTHAYAALEEIIEQLSMYRGAIVDGKDVKIDQYAANFGSVPELVMTFLQIWSAASDVPATRMLGQAPGGLNATGESDLENYYDMIAGFQQHRLMFRQLKFLQVFGCSVFGQKWLDRFKKLQIKYKPLWSMSEKDQAEVDRTYAETMRTLVEGGVLTPEQAIDELNARQIFKTDIKSTDVPEMIIEKGKVTDPRALLVELEKNKQNDNSSSNDSTNEPDSSTNQPPDSTNN